MKKIIRYAGLMILALSALSCTDSRVSGDRRYGYLTVGVSDELDDLVHLKSEEEEDIVYRLDLYYSDDVLAKTIEDHRTVTEEEPIELLMDKYRVTATSGEDGTAFNSPKYFGENTVRVLAETHSNVDINCKLGKIKFSVKFPEDDDFSSKFPSYELAVSNGETLTFASYDKPDDPSFGSFADTAYFEVPENRILTYTLKLRNADGAMYSTTAELAQVEMAEHYHFEFTLGEREEIDGAMVLNILLDGEFKESYEHKINLNFDKTIMPSYSTNPEFNPDEEGIIYPLGNDILKSFTFTAGRGIKSLVISHLDEYLLAEGLPQLTDFVNISDEELQIMEDIGITASSVSEGDLTAIIDITDFVSRLSISPDNKPYLMSLTVIDTYERYARCDFAFSIVSDIVAETVSVMPWSGFATLSGRFFSKSVPEGLSFEYRKVSDSEWTEMDPSLMDIDLESLTYSACLNNLEPGADYVFRATSAKDKADGKTATEIAFSTYPTEETVYNLSFDDWVKVGKAWYATDDYNNHLVWDSANEGTADILGQSLVPTTPEETIVISGKAARMESGELLGNFAAGNIYTGDFGAATLSPVGAKLDWGIPFNSRPLALRGWYRYEPVAINRTSSNYSYLNGQMDFCQIQIFLTNWSMPFEISTGDNRFVDTSENNPDIIAYGGFISQDNTTDNLGNQNGYIRFTIPLEYRSLEEPSYIVIAGAASRYGDYFTGGLGSTMYLDELELIYDPAELTPAEFEAVMKNIR